MARHMYREDQATCLRAIPVRCQTMEHSPAADRRGKVQTACEISVSSTSQAAGGQPSSGACLYWAAAMDRGCR